MDKKSLKFPANSEVIKLNSSGNIHVALVGGGMSSEREISLISARAVGKALIEAGYIVTFIDMGIDIGNRLLEIKPDLVYNCLHGTFGEDGCLPGLLNILRIPYTHSGVMASALAFNKKLSKFWFFANQINTARSIIVSKSDRILGDPIPRPYVIKPLAQGSSIGVEVIFDEDEFFFENYNFPYGDEVLIEEYIKGREMQVALLNGKALGVLEIQVLKRRFYDYKTKYTDGFANHLYPALVSSSIYSRLLSESEKIFCTMNCNGIARVEFIYDEDKDELFALEINTHPGMTTLSIVPEIALEQGINFVQLVEEIVNSATLEI